MSKTYDKSGGHGSKAGDAKGSGQSDASATKSYHNGGVEGEQFSKWFDANLANEVTVMQRPEGDSAYEARGSQGSGSGGTKGSGSGGTKGSGSGGTKGSGSGGTKGSGSGGTKGSGSGGTNGSGSGGTKGSGSGGTKGSGSGGTKGSGSGGTKGSGSGGTKGSGSGGTISGHGQWGGENAAAAANSLPPFEDYEVDSVASNEITLDNVMSLMTKDMDAVDQDDTNDDTPVDWGGSELL